MTPLPEICKECRHRVRSAHDLFPRFCLVWNRGVMKYDTCQFFESREKEKPKTETLWLYPGVAK